MTTSCRLGESGVSPLYQVYFGGPDFPAFRLRNLLAERIAAVPPGGAIDWVAYYFRDRRLAEELLRAHRKGVKIAVTLESSPRTRPANQEVISMLSGPAGLGGGLRTLSLRSIPSPLGKVWQPHLHEKLYCFSHPQPTAFIGSFNPSGDGLNDDRGIIAEIGDQDRGHNVLVELNDCRLVDILVNHARWLHQARHLRLRRFSPAANRAVQREDTTFFFWPRLQPYPLLRFLTRLGSSARIRIAASHVKGHALVQRLARLAQSGATVEMLAEPTVRRVPPLVEQHLIEAGIRFRRVVHPEGLPMHNKFVLAEKEGCRWVIFGSLNWTMRSHWLNYEIAALSTNAYLFKAFSDRWDVLAAHS